MQHECKVWSWCSLTVGSRPPTSGGDEAPQLLTHLMLVSAQRGETTGDDSIFFFLAFFFCYIISFFRLLEE